MQIGFQRNQISTISSQESVPSLMISGINKHKKIFYSIVCFVVVYMVNKLKSLKLSAKTIFSDLSVLQWFSSVRIFLLYVSLPSKSRRFGSSDGGAFFRATRSTFRVFLGGCKLCFTNNTFLNNLFSFINTHANRAAKSAHLGFAWIKFHFFSANLTFNRLYSPLRKSITFTRTKLSVFFVWPDVKNTFTEIACILNHRTLISNQ